MRALDAYRDLKRELDKHESPTFNVKDFNYFFNSGIDNWVAKNYASFPVVQKELDDIRAIIKSQSIAFSSNEATIPADYRHLLNLRVVVKFLVDAGKYKKDNQITIYPQRLKSGSEGYVKNNAFHRPSYKVPYYYMVGDKLRLDMGTQIEVVSATLDYIKKPATVYLNPTASDFTPEVDNTTIEFPDHVYYELVKECKRIFLENIESQRYQSTLNEEQMRP